MRTGRPKSQFCKRGHDTFVCGRTLENLCRECQRIHNKASYRKFREKRIQRARDYRATVEGKRKQHERTRAWQKKNKDKVAIYHKKWRSLNQERAEETRRNYALRALYGLTAEQHRELLKAQNNVCAICQRGPQPRKHFSVDHDHITGAVRGLLCGTCNLAIGYFRDSPEITLRAARYLTRHSQLHLVKEVS